MPKKSAHQKVKACAVSYFNTLPLVWGMLHGTEQSIFDLTLDIPSVCAELLRSGSVQVGIVSSIELRRQNLASVRGVGIASDGPVRSVLLVSKKPLSQIKSLAADKSSRTSVALSQIVLAKRFHVRPTLISLPPDISLMLSESDAALIIGDPALRLQLPYNDYEIHDLGQEWTEMSGLPMVYAVWASPQHTLTDNIAHALCSSYAFGKKEIERIISLEAGPRGFSHMLAREYFASHIVFELGPDYYDGLDLFLRYADELALI